MTLTSSGPDEVRQDDVQPDESRADEVAGDAAAGSEKRGRAARDQGKEANRGRASDPEDLRAFTFEVAPEALPDLVRAAGAPGCTLLRRSEYCLLGAGEALRISLRAPWAGSTALVARTLEAIETEAGTAGPVGGPVAMGALPYDPSRSGYLSIPRLLVAQRGGEAWATLVCNKNEPAPRSETLHAELRKLVGAVPAGRPPDTFTLTPSLPHDEWQALVQRALSELEEGRLAKVVLARRVDVDANRPFVLHDALARLVSLYPSCAVFRVEGFIGASPEILVRRTGTEILSHPLAGTVARSGNQASDDTLLAGLLASPKHRREHRLVVDEIASRLQPLCSGLDVPDEPSVIALRNVSHLGTVLTGTLLPHAGAVRKLNAPNTAHTPNDAGAGAGVGPNDHDGGDESTARAPTALEVAALLQPTPAVGGAPTEAALAWQAANEGFDRGWYAGPVGWVDSRGDGEWVLGLRSAYLEGQRASLYAGNGIVAGSDPQAELAETQLKLQALLAALVRP